MHDILTVTQFNKLVKEIVNNLGTFRITGEITEMRITSKKGLFITISDGDSNLKLTGYAPNVKGINQIEENMQVLVTGYCDLYVPYGNLSLSLSSIQPEGKGALAKAYKKLKSILEKKGFFDVSRKKALPKFIQKVALLTGDNSAAYADFTKILKEHNAHLKVDFYPVLVQGKNSVNSLLDTLDRISQEEYDVVVMTRGGGSLEDLKSFNDEEVVKKVFEIRHPIIVGVGHESDESLSDFAADIIASTPSQCAYYIVKQNESFLETIKEKQSYIIDYIERIIGDYRFQINNANLTIENYIDQLLEDYKSKISSNKRLLESYNVKSVLERGFAIIEKSDKIIKNTEELEKGDNLEITLSDGKLISKIIDIKNE